MDALTAMKQALEALEMWEDGLDPSRATFSLRAAIKEIDNWRLVPKIPTQGMLKAGLIGESRYARMLDAAPSSRTVWGYD